MFNYENNATLNKNKTGIYQQLMLLSDYYIFMTTTPAPSGHSFFKFLLNFEKPIDANDQQSKSNKQDYSCVVEMKSNKLGRLRTDKFLNVGLLRQVNFMQNAERILNELCPKVLLAKPSLYVIITNPNKEHDSYNGLGVIGRNETREDIKKLDCDFNMLIDSKSLLLPFIKSVCPQVTNCKNSK